MDVLVSQKNDLIRMVQNGEVEKASIILAFLASSWASAGYDYKTRELWERIRQAS